MMDARPLWVASLHDRVVNMKKQLEKDIENLQDKRKGAEEARVIAAKYGDLSENSEYKDAIDVIAKTSTEESNKTKGLNVLAEFNNDFKTSHTIEIGSSLYLTCEDGTDVYCKLMPRHGGSSEFIEENGSISCLIPIDSPLGKAVLGRPNIAGVKVTVDCPDSQVIYTINEIY